MLQNIDEQFPKLAEFIYIYIYMTIASDSISESSCAQNHIFILNAVLFTAVVYCLVH